jgi:hypothetical protein
MSSILLVVTLLAAFQPSHYFAIHVVDDQTGRGVPLIELRTVNDIRQYTDSAGWIAFNEPGLMNREVFFYVEGPGYEFPKDGFGFRGVRLTTTPGKTATVRVKRTNIAERLYRITGQGIYRDSELLGQQLSEKLRESVVLGQDSVQMVPYRGKLFWLWGDTNLANYPLGNFHTTAATTPIPGAPFDPRVTVPLEYFMNEKEPGKVRKMMPLKEPGPVWLFGLLNIKDEQGDEALFSHYTRRKSLAEQAEHGLARFNDKTGIFERIQTLDPKNTWQFPRHNAVRVTNTDGDYFYFAFPFCTTRVPANWKAICDPQYYEAFVFDQNKGAYSWRQDREPTTQAEEQPLIKLGKITKEAARYDLRDAAGKLVALHRASIEWNAYRKKWVLIGNEQGGRDSPSALGEVWYAEADQLTGPWRKAVKVASHPKYSFYNPRHHAVLDQDGGRYIYFEGTYTTTFSGNPSPTPRYEYNQLMYRLDLADERLR